MPQSLVRIYIHLVFSTKNRFPHFDNPETRGALHAYMAGTCRNLSAHAVIVGGHVDHVHVVCNLGRSIMIESLVKELKVQSSKWLKTHADSLARFQWQGGYAGFSISHSHLEGLVEYVRNQEEHHRKETYQEEVIRLLKKYRIEYDERYLWD